MKGDTDNQLCAEVNERGCYLLETAQYLDCMFLVGVEPHQEKIASHKLILALASRVFEAMFYGDLSEKNNPIHITDIQPETFKLLLKYIYTGNVHMNSVDEACNLYYAAKKYILQHLLEECSRYLWDHVDTDNVWQLLEFAQHYKEKELLLKCEKIFSMDTLDILKDSKFEDAELNTVLTVFSYDTLNIDSETHLVKAAARYAKAHNMRVAGRDIDQSPSDGLPTDATICAPTLNSEVNGVNAENGPEPVLETLNMGDARKQLESGAQAVDPGAPAIGESTKIKGIIEKIRFLSLTPAEFAECSERTSILTMSEEIAVIMNLASKKCNVTLPSHFSKCTFGRNIWRDCSDEKDDSRVAGSFTYTVYGFTHLDSVLSPPCYVLNLPWQLKVTKDENGSTKLSVQCSVIKNSNWSCEVNIVLRICKIQPEFSFVLFSGSSKVQNPASVDDYVFNATHLFYREHSAYFFPADTMNWTSYINRDGSVKFTLELKEKEPEAKQIAAAPNLFDVKSRPRANRNLSDHRIIKPVKKLRML